MILIPAYNEEKNLGHVLDQLIALNRSLNAAILVIDDASTDGTAAEARRRGVRCLVHPRNMGYARALQTGYRYAAAHGFRYVIQMDADGQHDVCNIPPLCRSLTGDNLPDVVLGSRFMPGSVSYDVGPLRRVAFAWFRLLIRAMSGARITDPTTGLQGLSRRIFLHYAKDEYFDTRYPDANVLLQTILEGYTVVQIPAVMHDRQSGRSMHAGFTGSMLYTLRATALLVDVWMRFRVLPSLKKKGGETPHGVHAPGNER